MRLKGLLKNSSMLVTLLVGSLILFVLFLRGRSSKTIVVHRAPEELREALAAYAKSYGFNPSTVEFILAISELETGHWTSSLYEENNNPWGMKDVKVRQTTDLNDGGYGEYAKYKNIESASLDFFYWLLARRAPKTFSDLRAFVDFIQSKGYSELNADEYYKRTIAAIQ